ncbi:MAG: exonuclease subunit SbcD [Spirochaetales bacterium]|nr:exonuclease subunit SbcD [Spirochaetales bacterium]
MRILHTADWHLGRMLYGRRRYEEFESFLIWLTQILENERIDALVVAGDIFDTGTPSNRAQELYYQFLCRVASSSCRHVVVTAGNHDSPSFLEAPKELLKALRVHVVGASPDNLSDEVVVLTDAEGVPQAVVAAVPYLRDRDLRTVEAGESLEDKDLKLAQGLQNHYAQVCRLADEKRHALNVEAPLIAMGHLFCAGGQTVEGDGVRELYVGTLAHVGPETFPPSIDYLALGHLHVVQTVGAVATRRYSGSPLPMGFGEVNQEKSVVVVEFFGRKAQVRTVPVPRFQRLARLSGSWQKLAQELTQLVLENESVWVELIYEDALPAENLLQRVEELVAGSRVEVLRVKNRQVTERVMRRAKVQESLEELTEVQVFERCLDAYEVPAGRREGLFAAYGEIVLNLKQEDINAS